MKLKKRHKSDIYITVLKDIISLTEEHNDYKNIIKYNKILDEYENKSENAESTDTIFFDLQAKIYKESQKLKILNYYFL
ncbi:hypothetical protein Q5M85_03325 [Paraclostridium bifermentans]|nr:hypothetical protein [Paraclostridium bifermentans]